MERITRFRAIAMLLIFCLILGFFSVRLYAVQVVETGGNKDNTTTYTTITRVKAARGEVLDRNGNVLISNRASYDLVFNNYVILSANNTNLHLQNLVQLCREQNIAYIDHFPVTLERPYQYTLDTMSTVWQRYFQAFLAKFSLDSDITAPLLMRRLRSIYDIPDEWTDEDARQVLGIRFELTLRNGITNLSNYIFIEDASDEARSAILELNIPGLKVEASTVREYHTTYGAHILGTVAPMDAAQWERYQNEEGYLQDAVVGQSGFELAFEEYLHGTDGWRTDVVTRDGTVVSQSYTTEPKSGNNVETTIDLNLQMVAEDSLAKKMQELKENGVGAQAEGKDAEGAAVVVMKVKTEEVLACASYPTYDLEHFNEKYDEILKTEYKPLYNRALQATYPPGSTYKMVMTIAGIESGAINKGTEILDEGVFKKYDDFSVACLAWTSRHTTHGLINVMQALEYSCNYFFYVVADKLKIETMDTVAKGLGLGEPTGVELGEDVGYRANPETKAKLYEGHDSGWFMGDQIPAGIGQSINRFSPMQLCSYICTLANRGTRYRATFLNRVVSADYRSLIKENQPEVLSTMSISQEAYEAYTTGMRMVASEEGGTAYSVFGNYSIPVAAKTGTAQHGSGGSDHGAFVCYAPADDPEIAIVIYGEKAAQGGNLGIIAKDIMDVYFSADEIRDVSPNENRVG